MQIGQQVRFVDNVMTRQYTGAEPVWLTATIEGFRGEDEILLRPDAPKYVNGIAPVVSRKRENVVAI